MAYFPFRRSPYNSNSTPSCGEGPTSRFFNPRAPNNGIPPHPLPFQPPQKRSERRPPFRPCSPRSRSYAVQRSPPKIHPFRYALSNCCPSKSLFGIGRLLPLELWLGCRAIAHLIVRDIELEGCHAARVAK